MLFIAPKMYLSARLPVKPFLEAAFFRMFSRNLGVGTSYESRWPAYSDRVSDPETPYKRFILQELGQYSCLKDVLAINHPARR